MKTHMLSGVKIILLIILISGICTGMAQAKGSDKDYKTGIVIKAGPKTVEISLGREEGVKNGNIFSVYSVTKVVKVPLAGEVSLKKEKEIGKIKVVRTDDHNSEAEIIITAEGASIEKGMTVIQIREKIVENEAPVIRGLIPDTKSIEGGKSISLNVTVEDKEGDQFFLLWNADKGNLAIERSSRPINRWTAPVKACNAVITVKAIDKWGNKAEKQITLSSTGTSGGSRQTFSKYRQLGSGMTPNGNILMNGVKFDNGGDMFILDQGKNGVFKHFIDLPYNPVKISRYTEGEEEAELRSPLCFDIAGNNIYVCDGGTNKIRVFNLKGDYVKTLGNGAGSQIGFLDEPSDIAVAEDGTLYITDTGNVCIEVLNSNGTSRFRAGKVGTAAGELQQPAGVELDAEGNIYVLDTSKKAVLVFNPVMVYMYSFVCEVPERSDITDMALDRKTNRIYILNSTEGQVLTYTKQGKQLGIIGGGENEKEWHKIEQPTSVGVSPLGQVYIGSSRSTSIARYNPEGSFAGKLDEAFFEKVGDVCSNGSMIFLLEKSYYQVAAVDYTGWIRNILGGNSRKDGTIGAGLKICANDEYLYVLDSKYYNVHKYKLNGEEVLQMGDRGSEPGKFKRPVDVALDGMGNLYVLDSDLKRVSIFNKEGVYVRGFEDDGNGAVQLKTPGLLTVSPDAKSIFIYDQKLYSLIKYSGDGVQESYFGSKGSSKPGEFYSVDYLALDEAGYCVTGESRYDRLQKINFTGPSGSPYIQLYKETHLYKGTELFCVDPYGRVLVYDSHGWLQLFR